MLYIMRHGKTEWNALHKIQGRTDIPLNEEGRLMAEKACEEYKDLHIDVRESKTALLFRIARLIFCFKSRENITNR